MTPDSARVRPAFLAGVQPVVLVGGRSRRFGRDKLREPWGSEGRALVQRPIDALRAVFGRRVKLVGVCDPAVVEMADGIIPDQHPGIGPMGGIVSALAHWSGPTFVLAGDMPSFRDAEITRILVEAEQRPASLAVWASSDRLHPCAGIYTPHALPVLEECISRRRYSLLTALEPGAVWPVPVSADAATNVNLPADLARRG